jgi:hypothetical protein
VSFIPEPQCVFSASHMTLRVHSTPAKFLHIFDVVKHRNEANVLLMKHPSYVRTVDLQRFAKRLTSRVNVGKCIMSGP